MLDFITEVLLFGVVLLQLPALFLQLFLGLKEGALLLQELLGVFVHADWGGAGLVEVRLQGLSGGLQLRLGR
jgi:hypothetical protein